MDQVIDTIMRSKRLLAWTIKHNIGLGKLQILDMAMGCGFCGQPRTHVYDFEFNTLMGKLSIRICWQCYCLFKEQAKKEKEKEAEQK